MICISLCFLLRHPMSWNQLTKCMNFCFAYWIFIILWNATDKQWYNVIQLGWSREIELLYAIATHFSQEKKNSIQMDHLPLTIQQIYIFMHLWQFWYFLIINHIFNKIFLLMNEIKCLKSFYMFFVCNENVKFFKIFSENFFDSQNIILI